MGGLAEAIEPGGYPVYTGQPWHPQLEMDQLVEAACFRKLKLLTDDWGIFTSVAERLPA